MSLAGGRKASALGNCSFCCSELHPEWRTSQLVRFAVFFLEVGTPEAVNLPFVFVSGRFLMNTSGRCDLFRLGVPI